MRSATTCSSTTPGDSVSADERAVGRPSRLGDDLATGQETRGKRTERGRDETPVIVGEKLPTSLRGGARGREASMSGRRAKIRPGAELNGTIIEQGRGAAGRRISCPCAR